MLVAQQRKYDLEQMQSDRDNQYRMGQIGAMRNYNAAPSIGEDDAMIEQEIRSGMYDPDVVKSLRDDQRAMRLIMRDKDIDGTQRAQALDNLRSRMRMQRSTGKVQPMMQQMPPAAVQGKPPMTEADYFSDPKNYGDAYAAAQARLQEGGSPVTPDNIHAQMHNDYLAKQKFLEGLKQPQEQASPQQSVPPAGGSQSQVGYRIQGQGPVDPKGVNMVLSSYPPQYVLNDGTQVDSVWKNGRWAPDVDQTGPRSQLLSGNQQPASPAMQGQATASVPGGSQWMSFGGERVFGVDPVLATPLPASSAQSPELANAPSGVRPAPNGSIYGDQGQYLGNTDLYNQAGANYIRQQASPQVAQSQPSPRKWTSADGKYSTDGEFLGVSNPTDGGEPMVKIKKTDGNVVDVPWSKLSDQDRMFASAGGNRDTVYDLQNRGRTPGTNFMDPENPVYKEMRSPQSQQQPNQGQFMGRYGLGGVDYGINQSTGNRVTASIRPGATAVEYDEPVGPPGTAMGGRRGSVSYTGRKKTVASQKSPGEATLEEQARYNALPASPPSSASGTAAASPPAATVTQPSPPRIRRDDPRVKEALAIAGNPDSVTADQRKRAAFILDDAGYTTEEIKAEIDSQGTSKPRQESGTKAPLGQPDYGTLLDAHETVRVAARGVGKDRRTIKQVDDAKAVLKASGWTDKDIQYLYMGLGDKNLDPPVRPQGAWQNRIFKPVVPQGEASPATSAENSVAQPPSSKMRTWTSVEGKTFDGVLVEGSLSSSASDPEDQQMIKVQRKDGEIFNIPVSRLSDEDKAYLDALYKLGNADKWLNRKGIGVSTGEAYKYEKPSSSKDSESAKSMTKQKYKTRVSEQPKEMQIKPNSSSMGRVKRTS
jgi:hypothetical protein